MHPIILHIETATETCSIAVSKGLEVVSRVWGNQPKAHASVITPMIEEALQQASMSLRDINAVNVSKGPGSYTGLRIGVATAKGLCFALQIPMLSTNTLQFYAQQFLLNEKIETDALLCPMIDARRMEVYTAVFDQSLDFRIPTEAKILSENSFADLLASHKIYFFGNGAFKLKNLNRFLDYPFIIENFNPDAGCMTPLAVQKYNTNQLEDIAYFEPFYLKDFVTQSTFHK
ncbi:MAG: tRNA (adenosine(37)-N6)-threonylcarbamoyltransferase complex dimerization subunit type 1 TsaB [Bacteroidetes bacterium]|nr:tRNA (adenosine(37)-N6)-threonylcarbamoyltransferase complex dimerization subunit type 1 TsaB [Bacteroidota bacterium]